MKVKIFTTSDDERREQSMNEWFDKHPDIKILFIEATESRSKSQYSSSKGKTVYVFYEKGDKVSLS